MPDSQALLNFQRNPKKISIFFPSNSFKFDIYKLMFLTCEELFLM